MSEGFCTACSGIIESFKGLRCCPHCQTTGVPCSNDKQVTVSVNIHELRVLCIWAENYENSIKEKGAVTYAIARRLRRQLPEGTSLTMKDEFQGLRDAGYDFETNHPAAKLEPEKPEH